MKRQTASILLAAIGCAAALCGCNSESKPANPAEAAQQKQQSQQNFNNLPPQVRPGSGPGK